MSTELAELVLLHTGVYLCRHCFREYRVFRASYEQLRCRMCAQRLVEAPDQAGYILEAARRLMNKMERQHQAPPRWLVNLVLSWVEALPPKTSSGAR